MAREKRTFSEFSTFPIHSVLVNIFEQQEEKLVARDDLSEVGWNVAQPIQLERWPFDINVGHECECCSWPCDPGVAVCPQCSTRLGEFSRPRGVGQAKATQRTTTEALAKCPHCDGVLTVTLKP